VAIRIGAYCVMSGARLPCLLRASLAAVLLTQIFEPASKLDILVRPVHVIVPASG
jgi:hypothetical protein